MKTKVAPAEHNTKLRTGALDDKELAKLYDYCTSEGMKEWWYAMLRRSQSFYHPPFEYSSPKIRVEDEYSWQEPIFSIIVEKIHRYGNSRAAFLKAEMVYKTLLRLFEWEADGGTNEAQGENGRTLYTPYLDNVWTSYWNTNEYGVVCSIRKHEGWQIHLMKRLEETVNRKWGAFRAATLDLARSEYSTNLERGLITSFANGKKWTER